MKLIQASFSKRVLMVGLLACSSILVASSFAMSTGEPTRKVGWEVKHGHNIQAEWVGQQWVGQRYEHMSDLKDKLKLNLSKRPHGIHLPGLARLGCTLWEATERRREVNLKN